MTRAGVRADTPTLINVGGVKMADTAEPMETEEEGADSAEVTNEEPMELTEEAVSDSVEKTKEEEREGSGSVDNAGERTTGTEAEVNDEETSTEKGDGGDVVREERVSEVVREEGSTGGSARSEVTGDNQQTTEPYQTENKDPDKESGVVRGERVSDVKEEEASEGREGRVESEVATERTEPYQKEFKDPSISDEAEHEEKDDEKEVKQKKNQAREEDQKRSKKQSRVTDWLKPRVCLSHLSHVQCTRLSICHPGPHLFSSAASSQQVKME